MRNAGQHHGAVLLDLCQLLGHAVKAHIHCPNLTGAHRLVQHAGLKVALAHPVSCKGQIFQRSIDQAGNPGGTRQRQGHRNQQPDHPQPACRRVEPVHGSVQPEPILIQTEANPQAIHAVDLRCDHGVGADVLSQFLDDVVVQFMVDQMHDHIFGFTRHDGHVFLVFHGFEQRHPVDGIRVFDRRPAQIDH